MREGKGIVCRRGVAGGERPWISAISEAEDDDEAVGIDESGDSVERDDDGLEFLIRGRNVQQISLTVRR